MDYNYSFEMEDLNFTSLHTSNLTMDDPSEPIYNQFNYYTKWQIICLTILAVLAIVFTICGNFVVILSFILDKSIRHPDNFMFASFAVCDILVGSVSMPLYTVYLLSGQYWPLGEVLCDLWLSFEYTVVMVSGLTVLCLTFDRLCMVEIPIKYGTWRTGTRIVVVIAFTWLIPVLVCFISIFGWQHFVGKRTVPEGTCYAQFIEDVLFNTFIQSVYFWCALTLSFVMYAAICKGAWDWKNKRMDTGLVQQTNTVPLSMVGQRVATGTYTQSNTEGPVPIPEKQMVQHLLYRRNEGSTPVEENMSVGETSEHSGHGSRAYTGESCNRVNEAFKTVTVILGVFILCLVPWHILLLISTFCTDWGGCFAPVLFDIFTWLCYIHSTFHPLCYAFVNQQFRKTFLRIMRLDFCKR